MGTRQFLESPLGRLCWELQEGGVRTHPPNGGGVRSPPPLPPPRTAREKNSAQGAEFFSDPYFLSKDAHFDTVWPFWDLHFPH